MLGAVLPVRFRGIGSICVLDVRVFVTLCVVLTAAAGAGVAVLFTSSDGVDAVTRCSRSIVSANSSANQQN